MRKLQLLSGLLLSLPWAGLSAAAEEFPLRSQYLDVKVIETEELDKRFDQVVIVDVRTKYEYDTLRIQDAILLPVTDRDFVDQVRRLREKTDKPIVFYCNGKTCRKSYDAVLLALSARIPNTLCYDAGVFDWAKARPDRAVLLGRSPVKAEDLIDDKRFKSRLLDAKAFEAKVEQGAIVLDVRDRAQRDNPLFPFRELRVPLNEEGKIDAIVEQAKREKRPLLIYDAVGRQVQWLQYRLEAKGLQDYYFLKGGAQGYWDAKFGKVTLGSGEKEKEKK